MTPFPMEVLTRIKVPMGLIHMKNRLYVDHLLSVHAGLTAWGMPLKVRLAGLLHSIYGTERFDFWRLDYLSHRKRVAEVVGDEAELLAYVNCALVRDEFDAMLLRGGPRTIASRFGGQLQLADDAELLNLCAIQLADWLDQVPVNGEWDYRYDVYRKMADLLCGPPLATFLWVYRNRRVG